MTTKDSETNQNYSTETDIRAINCIADGLWYEDYANTMRKRKKKIMDMDSYTGLAIDLYHYALDDVFKLEDEASNLRKEVACLQKQVARFRSERNRRIRVSA